MFSQDRVFIVAEIGVNHQGSIETALRLIDVAADAGCDAVKFQKKTPEVSLPKHLWDVQRDSPWGRMSYIDYRRKMEFDELQYCEIAEHCRHRGVEWFASPWDNEAAYFLETFSLPIIKVASACLTDINLLGAIRAMGSMSVIISTGMSSKAQVQNAVTFFMNREVGVLACTSTYPCPVQDLNLNKIPTLKQMFPGHTIGYSGHETGLWTTLMAVAMGARIVERHITLDRSMIGSDHAASIEPQGLKMLVREIRNFEVACGNGSFELRPGENEQINRLRVVQ